MARVDFPGIDLEPFQSTEAATLLCRLIEQPENPENMSTATGISSRLGGLPLAAAQVATAIRRGEVTLEEFLDCVDEDKDRDKDKPMGAVDGDQPPLMKAHYQQLSAVWRLEELSAEALTLLRVFSFLNPDSIPETIFKPAKSSKQSAREVPDFFPSTKSGYLQARIDLTKTSLVVSRRRRSSAAEDSRQLKVHRLVQAVVRAQIPEVVTLMSLAKFTVTLLIEAWPADFFEASSSHNATATATATSTATEWGKKEAALLPHVFRLQEFYQSHQDVTGIY